MREIFRHINMQAESLALVEKCNQIITEYLQEGLKLTLRQLYYQCVTVNLFPNTEKSYKRLGSIISDARLAGLMDWDAIEDRVRRPKQHSEWDNVQDLVDTALDAYRLPRWAGQSNYLELWVEKDALAGVLAPVADRWHVTLMVNRGYSSQSAMYESAKRFKEACYEGADCDMDLVRQPILLYLGDHDPSGNDMVRDVRDRLMMFGVREIEVVKLALNMDQIEEYDPPPNPAKRTDSRAAGYIAEHGDSSWELDALPPKVLAQLVEDAIRKRVNRALLKPILAQEEKDKNALRKAAERIAKGA